jgi:hypothetical protein
MANDPTPPFHQLMYGLLYPGVLGAGIVLTAVRAAHDDSASKALLDPAIHVAVTSAIFFMASFVSAFYWPTTTPHALHLPRYSVGAFACDVAEIVLMFICFHYLGLFELPTIVVPSLFPAYTALAVDVLLQFAWRKAAHIEDWNKLWGLRCLIAAVMLAGALFGAYSPLITILITIVVAAFVLYYISGDSRYHSHI